MNDRQRFITKMLLAMIPALIGPVIVILIAGRWDEILDMEDISKALYAEACALVALSLFILLFGASISAKLIDRLKERAFLAKGKKYERDKTNFAVYLFIAGIMVLFSIIYAQFADPYIMGVSRISIAITALIPVVLEYVVMKMTMFAIDYMEDKACLEA